MNDLRPLYPWVHLDRKELTKRRGNIHSLGAYIIRQSVAQGLPDKDAEIFYSGLKAVGIEGAGRHITTWFSISRS